MGCPQYQDGQHCYVPGVLRTVSAGDVPVFLPDTGSCCVDDALVEGAKRCACGDTVKAFWSVRAYAARVPQCTCPHGQHATDGACAIHVTRGITSRGFVGCVCELCNEGREDDATR